MSVAVKCIEDIEKWLLKVMKVDEIRCLHPSKMMLTLSISPHKLFNDRTHFILHASILTSIIPVISPLLHPINTLISKSFELHKCIQIGVNCIATRPWTSIFMKLYQNLHINYHISTTGCPNPEFLWKKVVSYSFEFEFQTLIRL